MQNAIKLSTLCFLSAGAVGLLVHCVGDDPIVAAGGGADAAVPGPEGGSGIPDADLPDADLPDVVTPSEPFGRIQQIVAGEAYTCVLGTSGQVRCWGSNTYGQLGRDRGEASLSDVSAGATVLLPQKVAELAAAYETVCARLEDLTLRCWGGATRGERGSGDKLAKGRAPGDMASLAAVDLGPGRAAERVQAGNQHFCVVVKNSGDVLCWGYGQDTSSRYGWLGNEQTYNVGDDGGEMGTALLRIPLPESSVGLAMGSTSTCALGVSGTVRCFGTARGGQLGNGVADPNADVIAVATAPTTATGVSALFGIGPAYAASMVDGGVVTWGDATKGRQGLGDLVDRFTPVPLPSPAKVRTIASGSSHRCVLLDGGDLHCVGDGAFGKLGYGNVADRGSSAQTSLAEGPPTRTGVAQVAVGGDHTCVVLVPDDGPSDRVICWGSNANGQLGPVVGAQLGNTGGTAAVALAAFRIE